MVPSPAPSSSVAEFDVFISYRSKDRGWVEATLLPRLTAWGVAYAIDFLHFDQNLPFEEEMNHFVAASRLTLIVLTANWNESPFTLFEADASAGRVVVLRLDGAPLPDRKSVV